MGAGVLLVVNCAADASYSNRHLLRDLYQSHYDELAFAVSATCPVDGTFRNIAQSWQVPDDSPECVCGDRSQGPHPALRHCFHPRLVDIAQAEHDCEYVVFAEDDCLLGPALFADAVRQRAQACDVLTPPIFHCDSNVEPWIWARHASGSIAYAAATEAWAREPLERNWLAYGGAPLPGDAGLPMFFGFTDCLVFRADFLRRLADQLVPMFRVWHEVAIPSTVIYHARQPAKLHGLALWTDQRLRPVNELIAELRQHDFVHPIKLSRCDPAQARAWYQAISST